MRHYRLLIPTLVLAVSGISHAACDTTFMYPTGNRTFTATGADGMPPMEITQQIATQGEVTTMHQVADFMGFPIEMTVNIRCNGDQTELEGSLGKFSLASSLPVKEKWTPGYTWTVNQNLPMNLMTISNFKVVGLEKVTTPAGTFDAYRVESDSRMDAQPGKKVLSFLKSGKPSHTVAWYAPGQGLVKQTVSSDGKVIQDMVLTKVN